MNPETGALSPEVVHSAVGQKHADSEIWILKDNQLGCFFAGFHGADQAGR